MTFREVMACAEILSKSDLIPKHFQGKPANCMIAIQLANRAGLDPFGVMQNAYVIDGKLKFEAKLAIALLRQSGKIFGPIRFRTDSTERESRGDCTATVIDAATGAEISHTLTWKTVEREGWLNKPGSKWKTDPQMMRKYRAAAQLIRIHYPEVILGVYAPDETEPDPTTIDSAALFREHNAPNEDIDPGEIIDSPAQMDEPPASIEGQKDLKLQGDLDYVGSDAKEEGKLPF